MVDQPAAIGGSAIMQSVLQGIQHKGDMGRPADPLTNNTADINIDHDGDVDEPSPGRDISEI